jgi:hypothetical protein
VTSSANESKTPLTVLHEVEQIIRQLPKSLPDEDDPNSIVLRLHQLIENTPNPDNSTEINKKKQLLTTQLTKAYEDFFIERKYSEMEKILKSLEISDKNLLGQYLNLLAKIVPRLNITPEQTVEEQDKSFEQFIKKNEREAHTQFYKDLFIQIKCSEMRKILDSLGILDNSNQAKLTQYKILLKQIVPYTNINPSQTEDEQEESFKQFFNNPPQKKAECGQFTQIYKDLFIQRKCGEMRKILDSLGILDDSNQEKLTQYKTLLKQIVPYANINPGQTEDKQEESFKQIFENPPQEITAKCGQLTQISKDLFIQRKLAEVKNLLYSLGILDSNQEKLTQYETLLREFVLQFDINPLQTEDEKNKSFKQFIEAQERKDEFLNISRELLIIPQLNELINCLKNLELTEEKAILETESDTIKAQIPIEQTPEQQDRFLEEHLESSIRLKKQEKLTLKERITTELKKLIGEQYKVKVNELNRDTRKPLPLEEQTESVLNYISKRTKTTDNDEPTDRFKKNLLANIKSLMPKDKPEEPLATYSFSRLIKIQKDLDAYLHPKLKIDETPSEALTNINNTSLLSNAMQAAIDSNGQESSCLGDKLCKVNILKIIKKQFEKQDISPEEKAFYLRLFLKTAGTHRNTNTFSFFQSPGTETATIQAFKKSLRDAKLPTKLSEFINKDIGEVLKNDEALRGPK